MTQEQWKPVVDYEGVYEVSDQGRVRSVDRWVVDRLGKARLCKGRVLRPALNGRGYLIVALWKNGKGKTAQVHRLVAKTFLGPCPSEKIVCHGRGGRLDNRLENLSYGIPSQNNKEDRRRDGTANIGEAHPRAKITEAIAIEILNLKGKMLQADIAKRFGISQQTVSAIQAGRQWPHLHTQGGRAMAAHATRNVIKNRHLPPFL